MSARTQIELVLLGVGLLILAIFAVSATRAYTSDDVSQQNMVATLALHPRPVLHLPQDTYIIKLPLYALLERLPLAPQATLLVTALVLNLAGFLLFYWAAWSFIRMYMPAQAPHLGPLVWLSSLGVGLATILINPNSRNLEIGLAFAALAVVARWYRGEWHVVGRAASRRQFCSYLCSGCCATATLTSPTWWPYH